MDRRNAKEFARHRNSRSLSSLFTSHQAYVGRLRCRLYRQLQSAWTTWSNADAKLVLVVTHDTHTALMSHQRIVLRGGAVCSVVTRTDGEAALYNGDLILYPACTTLHSKQETGLFACPSAKWLEALDPEEFLAMYTKHLPSAVNVF